MGPSTSDGTALYKCFCPIVLAASGTSGRLTNPIHPPRGCEPAYQRLHHRNDRVRVITGIYLPCHEIQRSLRGRASIERLGVSRQLEVGGLHPAILRDGGRQYRSLTECQIPLCVGRPGCDHVELGGWGLGIGIPGRLELVQSGVPERGSVVEDVLDKDTVVGPAGCLDDASAAKLVKICRHHKAVDGYVLVGRKYSRPNGCPPSLVNSTVGDLMVPRERRVFCYVAHILEELKCRPVSEVAVDVVRGLESRDRLESINEVGVVRWPANRFGIAGHVAAVLLYADTHHCSEFES